MNRDTSLAVAGVIVVIAVVVLAAGALATTRTTTTSGSSQQIPYPGGDGSTGVIFDLSTRDGFSFFGVPFQADSHFVIVAVLVPPECLREGAGGSRELLREGDCANLPVHGEVTGGGTSNEGMEFVIVRTEVSEHCFEGLEVGNQWPPTTEDCNE